MFHKTKNYELEIPVGVSNLIIQYGARPRAGHYTDSRYTRDQLEVIFLYSSAYALLV